MDDVVIHPALPEHHAPVLALLGAAGLPEDGLEEWWGSTLVARDATGVVGSAALEYWRPDAVLRSVCVAEPWRGRGLGKRLVREVLELAGNRGVRDVYLLTETAERFFARLGFVVQSREDAPAAVQRSVEYRFLCPQSATAMALRVGGRS